VEELNPTGDCFRLLKAPLDELDLNGVAGSTICFSGCDGEGGPNRDGFVAGADGVGFPISFGTDSDSETVGRGRGISDSVDCCEVKTCFEGCVEGGGSSAATDQIGLAGAAEGGTEVRDAGAFAYAPKPPVVVLVVLDVNADGVTAFVPKPD
jgi:hypothetical protein